MIAVVNNIRPDNVSVGTRGREKEVLCMSRVGKRMRESFGVF